MTGDPVQYQINRIERGWVVELVNNLGIIKKPDQLAVTDMQAVARVQLKPVNRCRSAVEWHSGLTHERPTQLEITLEPGTTEFVEFICK